MAQTQALDRFPQFPGNRRGVLSITAGQGSADELPLAGEWIQPLSESQG
jgi:hypothetical protein